MRELTSAPAAAALALPLIAATAFGALLAVGETDALAIFLATLAGVFILLDFRVGVVCLIVAMPLAASPLIPHSIGGIVGLNPVNLLLLATLGSSLIRGAAQRPGGFVPQPLLWLYIVPIVIAGAMGSRHVGEISAELAQLIPLDFSSVGHYVLNIVVKPLFLVLFAVLVAAATARSARPEQFVLPMVAAIWAMCLMTIVFAWNAGVGLAELSSSGARTLLSPLGIHANDLGRLYAVAYALLLYTCAASTGAGRRALLVATMALVVVALMLTFSRGAFFGFAVVNLLFLLSRRNALTMLVGLALLAALALLLPGAVFERIGSNWGGDLNTISAGRVGEIWLPLLPELERSPLVGNGLGSIAWSDAMRAGLMLTVGHAHNAYLGTLLDMGLVGLVALCAYFVLVWRGFRRLGTDPGIAPELRGFFAGAAAGLVSFMLAAFFGSSLTPATEQFFLWLAIGMMYGQRRDTTVPAPC